MKYYILKPKKLNLEYLVDKYQPDFKFELDKAYLLIYLVIKLGNQKNNSKKVELSSKMLQSLFGRNYNRYIRFFLENYPCDGNVLHGFRYKKNHPFGYKLTNYYFESGLELYCITDSKLITKYKEQFVDIKVNEQFRLNYFFVLKYFDPSKLTVFEPFNAVESTNTLDQRKRLKNALNLLNFINGECRLTLKSQTDGRVHSNLTRLSKKSRKFLRYKGEPLVEIDISSAVPFFLYLIIKYHLSNDLNYLKKFSYSNLFIYMLEKTSVTLDKSEVDNFGSAILKKELYEDFGRLIFNEILYTSKGYDIKKVMKYYNWSFKEMYGHYFDGDIDELKGFAKRRLLSMLFSKTHNYIFEQLVFKEIYPTILSFLNEYKNIIPDQDLGETILSKKDKHKKLSHLSFQFEAKVMIDHIAREFDKLHKGKVPIFTIHDCLLTTSSHADELKLFMENKFMELFGVVPNLTISKPNLETDYCEAC